MREVQFTFLCPCDQDSCLAGYMDIALIGGHGKIALLAEPLLVQAGHRVGAVIRNSEQAANVEATGATPVVVDIEALDPQGWDDLLRGRDAIIWSAGAGGGNPERTGRVDRDAAIASMESAERVGVRRYVMVSYFGARPDHGVPQDNSFFAYAEAKAAADQHLKSTDLDWTILKPSRLTLAAPSGRIDTTATESGEVSRGNVAQVIAAVVGRDDLNGVELAFNDGEVEIAQAVDGAVTKS